MNTKKQQRRKRVIASLEAQLVSGVKPIKSGGYDPLSKRDVERIGNEIKTLKSRI